MKNLSIEENLQNLEKSVEENIQKMLEILTKEQKGELIQIFDNYLK